MSTASCTSRWPLHPKPQAYETLERYVRRLAEGYGARYEYFCLRAPGIFLGDHQARWLQEPAPAVLQRLSDGTGVPVEQLAQMTWRHVWDRLLDEMRRIAATLDGQAEFERLSGRQLSQKS